MSDVASYLITVEKDRAQALEIARSSASNIESKQTALVDIVHSLREYVTDQDASIRSKAVSYLCHVVAALPPAFLNRQQILVLCQFLCDRIEDDGAVTGLLILQGLDRYNKEMAIMTFRAMLANLQDLQLRPQSQRYQIFELLSGLMSNHRTALKSLGPESLVGIVDLVTGEKDPRDLMIIFSILEVVIVEWDMAGYVETLFDAIFCYFPITFRPPPNDPYRITSQDLKSRLRECIAGSHQFAPYAFPQLLEKLDSTSSNVKVDVLNTISACIMNYSPSILPNYSITLWDSLKYEVFNAQEADIAMEALSVLQAIADQLAGSIDSFTATTPVADYLKPIIKECKERLLEPQHKQAKPAARILSVLTKNSIKVLRIVAAEVLPLLLTLYQGADTIEKRKALLDHLTQFLESARCCFASSEVISSTVVDNPLYPFKDDLFKIFSQALMSTAREEFSFRLLALKCLSLLCTLRSYLTGNEIGMVVQYFNEIISERANTRHGLKDAAIEGLVDISKFSPRPIVEITFPTFIALLPTSVTPGRYDYVTTLDSLARVSVEPELASTLVRRLFRRLDDVLQIGGSSDYCHTILATLKYVLSRKGSNLEFQIGSHFEKVIELLKRAAKGSQEPTALNQINALDSLGQLACLITREVDPARQDMIGRQVYSLFTEHSVFVAVPSQSNASENRRSSIILSTYLLAAIRQNTSVLHLLENFQDLLNDLVRLATHESSIPIRHSLLQHIALLVNKFATPQRLQTVMGIIGDSDSGLFSLSGISKASGSLRVVLWLCKALVMRLSATSEIMGRLIKLLTNAHYGTEVARGFAVLLAPDKILSPENGAIIRFLAPQRVLSIYIPAIAKMFQGAEAFVKSNYLIALSGLIKHVQTRVLLSEVSLLLPLLLQSLDLEDQTVKATTVETLTAMSRESPEVLEEHVPSLINRLVAATADSQTNCSKVRYNALRCIKGLPGNIKETNLLPYRKAITRGTLAALDDPRRHVRKEAVDCQTSWLRLDNSEEHD